jgi:hypothetical protein
MHSFALLVCRSAPAAVQAGGALLVVTVHAAMNGLASKSGRTRWGSIAAKLSMLQASQRLCCQGVHRSMTAALWRSTIVC